jgi:glutathione S-transferase
MIKLYGHEMSGNSYKVRLFLELLNLDYEWIKVDLMKGEHILAASKKWTFRSSIASAI